MSSQAHTEYRDDRFIAAFDRTGQDKATFTLAYVVRAVTPGHYVLPPQRSRTCIGRRDSAAAPMVRST